MDAIFMNLENSKNSESHVLILKLTNLVILFLVLPSNFIVSGVTSSRLYPFLIINVTLFSPCKLFMSR